MWVHQYMKRHFFLYQETLEDLLLKQKIVLDGDLMLLTDHKLTFRLTPAVKVLSCETSTVDPLKLTGKFIPSHLLTQSGADLFLNSFILADHSYRIETGFLGNLLEEPSSLS